MDQARGTYGSSERVLRDLLVICGRVWITRTLVDTVQRNLWIQYEDKNGSSAGADMDPVMGHLWLYA